MASQNLRILVTGGNGFVAHHLIARLAGLPEAPEIITGVFQNGALGHPAHVRGVELDVTDIGQVRAVIAAEQPSHIVHLAALSAPASAQRNIEMAWKVNAEGAFNVALAALEAKPQPRLIHCSTAEVYGKSFRTGEPLDETAPIAPGNVYGASKAAADLMIGQLCGLGLRAVRLRPFNHTGAGQSEDFVVPAFGAQIARIERGLQEPIMRVGDLTARRDFLDINDVVDAYVAVIRRFDELPPCCVLNLASGRTIAIKTILDKLLSYSGTRIKVETEAARLRASETSIAVGNAELAHRLLGWKPTVDFDHTLRSILDYYRDRLRHQAT